MLDSLLFYDLDGTLDVCLDMLPQYHFTERALAKDFKEFIVLMNIFDFLATLEVLECDQLPVCLL